MHIMHVYILCIIVCIYNMCVFLCTYAICTLCIVFVYICAHVCISCSYVMHVLCIYLIIHAQISPLTAASTKQRQANCCSLHHQRTWKVVSNRFIVKSGNFQASAWKTEK